MRPLVGVRSDGPADGVVLAGPGDVDGLAIGIGVNPWYGLHDPEAMAYAVVDEAIRNIVAVGADPDRVSLLDNFSWGDPRRASTLGDLVAAVDGCCAAAIAHGAPFVSGKDSLNNEYTGADGERHAVPPTLVITAVGHVPDADACVTPDLAAAGNALFLLGSTRPEFAGSHLDLVLGPPATPGTVPAPDPGAPARYRNLHRAIRAGLVRSCHDVSEGGLAVALAEMCIGGRLGAAVTALPHDDTSTALFAESASRLVVEVAPVDVDRFHELIAEPIHHLGHVTDDGHLSIVGVEPIHVDELVARLRPGRDERMTRTKAIVITGPGTNRDGDAAVALRLAGADPTIVSATQLVEHPAVLDEARLAVVAGGFSYGDALGAGRMLALDLTVRLGDALREFVAGGRPLIGICNGFQVLTRTGLLARLARPQRATGASTADGSSSTHSRDRACVWTRGLDDTVHCPIAHGEGRYVHPDVDALAADGQVALRYRGSNPNGSVADIAGVCNASGTVLGLMPHPENHVVARQHPHHRRGGGGPSHLGLRLFENGVEYARAA